MLEKVGIRGGPRDGETFQLPLIHLHEGMHTEFQHQRYVLHRDQAGWYARPRPQHRRPPAAQPAAVSRASHPPSTARYEFFGGPLDTEMLFVPTTGGEPCEVVYCRAAGGSTNYPRAAPDRIDGPWVQYRFNRNVHSPLRSTYQYQP